MPDQVAQGGLLSPFLQRRRIAAVRPFLRGRVLDVGCGNGALAPFCEPAGYIGFDAIVALALIEHILNPGTIALSALNQLFSLSPDDRTRNHA